MPAIRGVAKVTAGGERESDLPQELVPAEPVPVPHAQPQGARGQLTLRNLILQGKESQSCTYIVIHV